MNSQRLLGEPLRRAPRAFPDPRRWWVLTALSLSLLVVGLDGSILNVALTDVSRSMEATTTELQWVVNGYSLTSASLLVPAGVLGDRLGRARVLAFGLTLFLAASAVAAFSGDVFTLIAARSAMGVGAAAVFPLALSIIATVFGPEERPRAVAAVTAAMGVGMPLGPILGGWLLDHYWWGSTMLVNLPVVGIALVAGLLVIPESRGPRATPVDAWGITLTVVALGSLVYGVVQGPVDGWTAPNVGVALALPLLLGAFLVSVERRAAAPLLDVQLLSRRLFTLPTVAMALTTFVMLGLLFTMPMYFQAVRGYSALRTGLLLTPLMMALMLGAGAATRLVVQAGLRWTVVAGLVIAGFGLLPLASLQVHSGYGRPLFAFVTVGFGFGLAMTPLTDAVLGSLAGGRESTGMALNLSVKQTGGVLGVAVLGAVLTATYRGGMASAVDPLPASLREVVRTSVVGGRSVAERLPAPLGGSVRSAVDTAFVNGIGWVATVCALSSLMTAVVLAITLPRTAPASPSESQTR